MMQFLKCEGRYANAPRPDLVLLDLKMPRKDGHCVLREVKSDGTLKTIPIIALTTSTATDDIRSAYELHANAYAYLHAHEFGGTNPTLLKALGFGNCILAMETPFNREVLGDHGLFFRKDEDDLLERLQTIVEDRALQSELSRRAPDRIREKYTWDIVTDQYDDLFRDLGRA